MSDPENQEKMPAINRRRLLQAAGTGVLGTAFGSLYSEKSNASEPAASLRWGIVGTGMIANAMAPMIARASKADLAAVSSRRMSSAEEFASRHDIGKPFDSWEEMAGWTGVDALYIATPTSVKEEISIAAANKGKHVLVEKPFASVASLGRIFAACRANGVGFMDGTHFVHAPRSHNLRQTMDDLTGWPWSLDSAFQFNLTDRSNIRYNREVEPMGAIGDAGWYNMRAAVEYLKPGVRLVRSDAYLRRDRETGAAISGSGVMQFDDGATSTWNCGFDSGALVMDLRISGGNGSIFLDDFIRNVREDGAIYTLRKGGVADSENTDTGRFDAMPPAASLMFEQFATMAGNEAAREQSMLASERTQELLDAAWASALSHEASGS